MSNIIDSRLIGKSIKSLRLRHHLTQEFLADDIGYSTRNIRRIETNGTTNIDVVNAFAEYFNVSAMDILNGCSFFIFYKSIASLRHTIFTVNYSAIELPSIEL